MELDDPHGLMPDEFHNTHFEEDHPEMIHPVHYDHYDPQVEGFYGPGFSFDEMEREHHSAEHMHHDREREELDRLAHMGETRFTPGHFALGDMDDYQDYHHSMADYGGHHYHHDIVVRDVDDPDHIADERTTMDLYRKTYETPKEAYDSYNPYDVYPRLYNPPRDPKRYKPMPQEPLAFSSQKG